MEHDFESNPGDSPHYFTDRELTENDGFMTIKLDLVLEWTGKKEGPDPVVEELIEVIERGLMSRKRKSKFELRGLYHVVFDRKTPNWFVE